MSFEVLSVAWTWQPRVRRPAYPPETSGDADPTFSDGTLETSLIYLLKGIETAATYWRGCSKLEGLI